MLNDVHWKVPVELECSSSTNSSLYEEEAVRESRSQDQRISCALVHSLPHSHDSDALKNSKLWFFNKLNDSVRIFVLLNISIQFSFPEYFDTSF